MVTSNDPHYDEYLQRREREGFDGSGTRFTPSRKGTSAKGTRGGKGGKEEEDDNYEWVQYGYKSDGYQQKLSKLGEDPISAVRTLKNQMRNMMIDHRNEDRPVKAHLCQNACDELSRTEGQLVAMNKQRTTSIMMGDSTEADRIKRKMEQVKEDAVRNVYADLVVEDGEMRAFGVESEWAKKGEKKEKTETEETQRNQKRPPSQRAQTPERRQRTPTKRGESKERPSSRQPSGGRFRPSNRVDTRDIRRRKERQQSPDGDIAPDIGGIRREQLITEYDSNKQPSSIPYEEIKGKEESGEGKGERDIPDVKKNDRLSNLLRGEEERPPINEKGEIEDDPYKPKTNYGKCDYCDILDPNFGRRQVLERHMAKECKMLNRCRYCGKVVEISKLTDHYLDRCDFLGETMQPCRDCSMAADRQDIADGMTHPLCRGKPAPSGTQWCALCAVAVREDKESWKKHLMSQTGCYNNPRLKGGEMDVDREREMQRRQVEEKRQAEEKKVEDEKKEIEREKKKTLHKTQSKLNGVKLINADELVIALQAAKRKKEKEKKAEAKAGGEDSAPKKEGANTATTKETTVSKDAKPTTTTTTTTTKETTTSKK